MKYEMLVRVEVRQIDEHGSSFGGGLNVNESFPFEANNFGDLCSVLTKFHDLADSIRKLRTNQ